MPRPLGGDRLDDEMVALREAGVDVLVSLQTEDEQRKHLLSGEPVAAVRAGMVFHQFPIVDFGVPDRDDIQPLLQTLHGELDRGRHVAIHCFAGIGRSSLVAAALLVRQGVSPDQAWQTISTARGRRVPETDEQRSWLTRSP